jgi:hypothetical protein
VGYVMGKPAGRIHSPCHPGAKHQRRPRVWMIRVFSLFRQWFRSMVRVNGLPPPGIPVGRGQAAAVMPVLLASERDNDYQNLQALLHNTKWTVGRAISWSDVQVLRPRCKPGRVVGPPLSRLRLAVLGFLASLSRPEPLSDSTFGCLRPVLVERAGTARRLRRSRAAIRILRAVPHPGICAKALRSRLAAFTFASGKRRLAHRKV